MIEDAKIDTANIHRSIRSNNLLVSKFDTLAQLCYNYKPGSDPSLYRLFRISISEAIMVNPSQRTLSQLKNSGAMRLLRKKTAVDSILNYEEEGKRLSDQQTYVERYFNDAAKVGLEIFNINYYASTLQNQPVHVVKPTYADVKLLKTDRGSLLLFANYQRINQGVTVNYIYHLKSLEIRAQNLIKTLKEQYDIQDTD